MYTPAHIVAKRITSEMPDDSEHGELRQSTKIGIAVGFFLFLTLLLGFYIVSKWRRRAPKTPTREDEEIAMTYARWQANVAGKGKSARLERNNSQNNDAPPLYLPPYTPRATSISGSTIVGEYEHVDQTMSPPPTAYISHGRAESNDLTEPRR